MSSNSSKRMYDGCPKEMYRLEFENLNEIFGISEMSEEKQIEIFSKLHPFIDHPVYKPKTVSRKEVKLTKTVPRIFHALFVKDGEYQFFQLEIKKSTIPKSGMGVYARENIPKGWRAQYVGEPTKGDGCNPYYSFTVQPFKKSDGEPNYEREPYMYLDGTLEKKSNWTRTINCKKVEEENNFEPQQLYDQIWCEAKRNIREGEELFLWYGEDYVKEHMSS